MIERLSCHGPRPVRPLRGHCSDLVERGLAAGRLELQCCETCATVQFPPAPVCGQCSGRAFTSVVAGGRGILYSFTRIHAAPAPLARRAPYAVGLVDLDEGVRLLLPLIAARGEPFRPDQRLRLVLCDHEDGPVLAACLAEADADTLVYEPKEAILPRRNGSTRPDRFEALMIERHDGGQRCGRVSLAISDLPPGDTIVKVAFSSLNYKDALALTGRAPIARRLPMVPGIDLAGTIVESASPAFAQGDQVVVNGFGLSETRWGGYSEYQSLPESIVMPLPAGFSLEDAMLVGTAGYTAMLSVLALLDHGLRAGHDAVLVTGATGGVGSLAVALLARLGFHTIAVTGRPEQAGFLTALGATEVVTRDELGTGGKALGAERWAGAIDVAGGRLLADVLAQIRYDGIVASCGMAAEGAMPSTVYPFILRGVTLRGIDSVMVPMARRRDAWGELDRLLDRELLRSLGSTHDFDALPNLAEDLLEGRLRGRIAIRKPGA